MADPDSMTVSEAAGKMLTGEHADVLREAVRLMLREIMEGEVSELAGGERYERSGERSSYRTATASAASTPGSAASSWRSRGCAPAATSRASSSRVAAPSRPWWPSWPRPT